MSKPKKTVIACVPVLSATVFDWLGHMPIMNWALENLRDVRGLTRVVCVVPSKLAAQTRKLVSADKTVEVVVVPDAVCYKPETLDAWLVSAAGPAGAADTVLVVEPTKPFLPAAKIESCVNQVTRGKASLCVPAREAAVVGRTMDRVAKMQEVVSGVRAFRVVTGVPAAISTVSVSLVESLNVDEPDEYVLADAMVSAGKV